MHKYLIDHLDPLGQGVYKRDDQVYFIPKTLPGEAGSFKILKKKKGVHFCQSLETTTPSQKRIDPSCPHFQECPGCHYLHTSYEDELFFKELAFERLLAKYETPKIEILQSDQRLGYRNRIQLHYNQNQIGFVDGKSNKIIPVPSCQIFIPDLQAAFNEIQMHWKEKRRQLKQPSKGHVELYYKDGKVQTNWNQRYAQGGFSQINQELNTKVVEEISHLYPTIDGGLIELFGGDGNLSQNIDYDKRVCVDFYKDPSEDQLNLDLYQDGALDFFISHSSLKSCQTLFLDPPRSGFKDLDRWVEKLDPEVILYMSCHPATQAYDIRNLVKNYAIKKVQLIDFFPGTYHFESVIAMHRNIS